MYVHLVVSNLPPAVLQNDCDPLCATAVTCGWNGYWKIGTIVRGKYSATDYHCKKVPQWTESHSIRQEKVQNVWCTFLITFFHSCSGGGLFLTCEDLGRMFDNSVPACTLYNFFLKRRLAHAHLFHSLARINPQRLSKLRWLWLSVPNLSCVSYMLRGWRKCPFPSASIWALNDTR